MLGIAQRKLAIAGHHRTGETEREIVRVVHRQDELAIHRRAWIAAEVHPFRISLDRLRVDDGSVLITASMKEGVRRHVHEMARKRGELAELVCVRNCILCATIELRAVNIVMDRAGVVGIGFQHGLDERERLFEC